MLSPGRCGLGRSCVSADRISSRRASVQSLQNNHRLQHHRKLIAAASNGENGGDTSTKQSDSNFIIFGTAIGLTCVAGLGFTVFQEDIADFAFQQAMSTSAGWGPGDIVGGALWGLSMWFCSPLQLLLLFLGKIDTERPSDLVLRLLGQAAGLPVTALDYEAPLAIKVVAAALFGGFGLGLAALFSSGLGDSTWSISTGIGACLAAGVYEVGRPRRIGVDEAQTLESQWQDFAKWSSTSLQRGGRCHESEVFNSFRRAHARYRTQEAITDAILRDMVRNWHPTVERTAKGYYRNLSLAPRIDAFSGKMTGTALVTASATSSSQEASDTTSNGNKEDL